MKNRSCSKLVSFSVVLFILTGSLNAQNKPIDFSKAVFFEIENSGREVFDFNIGWRFYKGIATDAFKNDFDDSKWDLVNCPNGLEYLFEKASGSNNYQGEAWYRKRFTANKSLKNKVNKIHFEAVMGKCKVWLNGKLLAEHFGGYLPFSVDISNDLVVEKENVLVVWADNSDDISYAPGKEQTRLDFAYFGGIYRDVWLTSTAKVFVTNPNEVDKIAGGGVFVHTDLPTNEKALIHLSVDVQNEYSDAVYGYAKVVLKNPSGKIVRESKLKYTINANLSTKLSYSIPVSNPDLWTPWSPNLYRIEVLIFDNKNKLIDGVAIKTGIRKIEFKGKEGFFLNNKLYPGKLMGANRHQDYAIVGNALPNNGQWRDAVLLKNAGCDVIRAAHYPADPAFMEACDALGMFFIVATPGWQFWNADPLFEQRVISDIKNMVRRDRNHPSVILWEPILNETWYPDYFAEKVHKLVHQEYPYQGAYTACDLKARGQEHFDVIYSQPYKDFFTQHIKDTPENRKEQAIDYTNEKRCVFTREWGDCVDDWSAQNSPSRVVRAWGERAQLVQSKHYAAPDYLFPSWETFYSTPTQHIGGAVWHSFDHQRGYNPDPFYGGLTDVFRQPKYSYYLFSSQRNISEAYKPMIYIAHDMSPISEPDVTVYTNCEEVRLIVYGKDTLVQKIADLKMNMPHPAVTFKNVYNFMDVKEMSRKRKENNISIVAEGLVGGKVVATYTVKPSLRGTQVSLSLVDDQVPLVANGSDFVRVIASITDAEGNIKRLDESYIKFEIQGEGAIIGNEKIFANPRKLEWGTAPVLIRSTLKSGKITIKASVAHEGKNTPVSGILTIESQASTDKFIYNEIGKETSNKNTKISDKASENLELKIKELEQELMKMKLKEVEKQQQDFEGN